MPSAMSSDSAPVGMDSTSIEDFSPIFMTEPLPYCFSIWLSAISSAFSRSRAILLSSLLFAVSSGGGSWTEPGRRSVSDRTDGL